MEGELHQMENGIGHKPVKPGLDQLGNTLIGYRVKGENEDEATRAAEHARRTLQESGLWPSDTPVPGETRVRQRKAAEEHLRRITQKQD